jgi:hypothetical protein
MTTTTQTQTNNRSSHMPSQRDLEIFRQAEVHGLTHQQLAGIWKVSRRRISQVVERVRNWLSLHPCEDAQIATELQRKRLNQHLERMQLQDVIDRARFALNMPPSYLESVTVRADGKESTTRRQQPPVDVQMLKTLLRAIEAQGRLNARPEIPLPPPPEGEFPWLKAAMNEVWEQWSDKIAWNKKLKPDLFCKFADEFEAAVLKAVSHQKMLDSQLPDEAHEAEAADDVDNDIQEAEAPAWGSEAPAEPIGAASEPVGRAMPADNVGRGSPDPAPSATEGLPESTDVSTLDLGPGTSDSPSAASQASAASQREAPTNVEPGHGDEVTIASSSNTCAAPSPAEATPRAAQPSQENRKREAPLARISESSLGPIGADRIEPWVPTHG